MPAPVTMTIFLLFATARERFDSACLTVASVDELERGREEIMVVDGGDGGRPRELSYENTSETTSRTSQPVEPRLQRGPRGTRDVFLLYPDLSSCIHSTQDTKCVKSEGKYHSIEYRIQRICNKYTMQ